MTAPCRSASTQRHFGHASVTLATPASLWPRQRHFGHASVALATPAAKITGKTGTEHRSRGQGGVGVAKDAGRDPPAEARVAAVTGVTKPAAPGCGRFPVSETTIRNLRRRSAGGGLDRPHSTGERDAGEINKESLV